MDLFKRFPKLRVAFEQKQAIIPEAEHSRYPAFKADFAVLETELMGTFRTLDTKALRYQNAYRWMYVILIFGGTLATILGIVQLAIDAPGIGLVETVVATCLGCATLALRSFHYQERYMAARLAAEELRGEYFLFLGRSEPYAKEQDRLVNLKQRVILLKNEEKAFIRKEKENFQ
jgi:hypothetical protein